ncbi:nuclear transport factor 2 family protein, partial [Streptomyces sp. SID625]|nr:nuclear transport factor 2 family protein [Streptomyces sp. SID625]
MSRTDIRTALTDLLLTPGLTMAEAAERHFTPDYRQRTDGEWAD